MDSQLIQGFFEKLKDDSLSFLYHGFMSDDFTTKIISIIENNIEKNNEPKAVRSKVSFLVAESFQNIFRHGESFDKDKYSFNKPGFFQIRLIGDVYIISTTNLISHANKEVFEKKILEINSLDKDQLKTLQLEVLGSLKISDKGGAGLGLIDMARKSDNKLEYYFDKINDEFSLVYLQLKFHSKSTVDANIQKFPLTIAKEFHEIMDQNNTYLIYKGDFSQENVLTLLKIIERNLQINPFENESFKSLIYLVLTELLQNISKHSYCLNNKKMGVFLLGKYFNKYILSTGNFIENNQISSLKERIDSLNSKSKMELRELYVDIIKNGYIDSFGNTGLGFIEIKKGCDEINYTISPINHEYSFLTISVNI